MDVTMVQDGDTTLVLPAYDGPRERNYARHPVRAPKEITPEIREFAATFGPGELCRVPVQPLGGCGFGACYDNCDMVCESTGWERVLGWCFWIAPGLYLTAEHHCVCRRGDGQLLCVTPDPDSDGEILFLPTGEPFDMDAIGRRCRGLVEEPNTHLPLTDHPSVVQAVEVLKAACRHQAVQTNRLLENDGASVGALLCIQLEYEKVLDRVEALFDRYLGKDQRTFERAAKKVRRKAKKAERRRKALSRGR